jgi:hypothetical protein
MKDIKKENAVTQDLEGNVGKATLAVITLIKPVISNPKDDAADKVYYTLMAVMDYPSVKLPDKLAVINGVARYLIKNCGIDSPLTEAALSVSVENNNFLN